MAVAVVQHKEDSNTTILALGSNATSGNIIVLLLNQVGNTSADTITGVSGVAGTWTKAIGLAQAGGTYSARLEIWIGTNLSVANTVTLTSSGYAGLATTLQELSGAPGTSILSTSTNKGTGTSTDTGTLTPGASSGRLVIGAVAVTSFGATSGGVTDNPASFTNLTDTTNGSITKLNNTGYREVTSTSGHSRAQTWVSMDSWVGGLVELGAVAANPVSQMPLIRRRASLQRSLF